MNINEAISAANHAMPDPVAISERMSTVLRLGEPTDLMRAVMVARSTMLDIAVHAPFVPMHVYANVIGRPSPMAEMAFATEDMLAHVVGTMDQNARVLEQEGLRPAIEAGESLAEAAQQNTAAVADAVQTSMESAAGKGRSGAKAASAS